MNSMVGLILTLVFYFVVLCAALFPSLRKAEAVWSKRLVLSVCALTPLLVIYAYFQLGAYQDLQIREEYQRLSIQAFEGQPVSEEERWALIEQIKERVESTDKADYWYLLAGNYEELGDFALAAEAYGKSAETYSEDVNILARWAEMEFINQGYNLTPKVEELVLRTLQLDPVNASVLGMLGIAAFQQGQFEAAIEFWARGLSGLPPTSNNALLFQQSIAQAQSALSELAGSDGANAPESTQLNPSVDGTQSNIALRISLADGLSFEPAAAVFVFARIPGSPVPTAVSRLSVSDLPANMVLDDSMVMIPGTQLMTMPLLEVVARVSVSGEPTAQSGDYEVIVGDIVPAELEGFIELVIADQIN